MIKNVIFDFGQVLVHFEPEYMVRQYVDNEDDVKRYVPTVLEMAMYPEKAKETALRAQKFVNERQKETMDVLKAAVR